jgi:hypothetical protein
MATPITFNDYAEQQQRGVHQFGVHTFKLAMTNTPPLATHAVKTDLPEIAAGNGYVAGGYTLTLTVSETAGVSDVMVTQVTVQASGGPIAGFRYYYVYNDTAASKNLVCAYDYGSTVNLGAGESIVIRFNNASPGAMLRLQKQP